MMRWVAPRLPVLTGFSAMLWGQPALAGDDSCPALVIEADAAVTARWPGLLSQVRETFDVRDDIDRCARVTLSLRDLSIDAQRESAGVLPARRPIDAQRESAGVLPARRPIAVEAVLPDGRSAARLVWRREDVVPTIEALLLVPRPGAPADPSTESSTAPSLESSRGMRPAANPVAAPAEAPGPTPPLAPDVPLRRALAAPDRDTSLAASVREPKRFGIELSVAAGGRVGGDQTSVGLGALSFLDLSGWLVGFEGRADRYRALGGSTSGSALEVAVLGGRRFRFSDVALDLTAGLGAAMQGAEAYGPAPANPGNMVLKSTSSSGPVPRLQAGVRVTFGARSTVRTFIALDGEVGPARATGGADVPAGAGVPAGADAPGAPRLPVATLGLALGATLGTR
jgi:hypothetical protein